MAKKYKKPINAYWEPVKEPKSGKKRLESCVKWVALFAALNLVLFYWQQKGLLADSAGIPAMWVCALLGGCGIGATFGGANDG